MPVYGDKFYRVDWTDYTLEVVKFIQQQIHSGATIPTYTLQDKCGNKFSCATNMYFATEREAWQEFLSDCQNAQPGQIKQLTELCQVINETDAQIKRVKLILENLS